MGWICPNCFSENPFSRDQCAACRTVMPRRYLKRERLSAHLMLERLTPLSPQAMAGAARPLRRAGNTAMLAALCLIVLSLPAAVQSETMAQNALRRMDMLHMRVQSAADAAGRNLTALADAPAEWADELHRTAISLSQRVDAALNLAADRAIDAWQTAVQAGSQADDKLHSLQTKADSPAAFTKRLLHFITGRN